MPLQARRTGDPLLAATTVAVRIPPTSELRNLHDGMLRQAGNQRLAELEREQLRLADRLLWPGGDCLDSTAATTVTSPCHRSCGCARPSSCRRSSR